MTRSLLVVALALAVGLMVIVTPAQTVAQPPAQPGKANPEAEEVERVRKAIDKGVGYLKATQDKKKGHWEGLVLKTLADMDGGMTALATLALLNCGLTKDDQTVKEALKYLENLEPSKTYVRALQTMVFAETRDPKYQPKIAKNVDWLQKTAIFRGGKLEGWSYPGGDRGDNSNTQYAVLALYAAKTAGVKIDSDLWEAVQEYYSRTQKPDARNPKGGYWTYTNYGDKHASFSMSVAGTCGLWIARMGLDKSEQQLNEATGVAAKCGFYSQDDALAKGMFWVATNFNFNEGKSFFYNYYGIERLGRLSGQRFIGKMDWYREGCERLVKMQKPDGSFLYTGNEVRKTGIDSGYPAITTSFALLFLSKGRTPVLISKFAWGNYRKAEAAKNEQAVLTEYDVDDQTPAKIVNWNRKHSDCRNLVDFASREIFENAPLSWQVYDMRLQNLTTQDKIDFEVGYLLQSPLLYLNGHGKMPFVTRPTETTLSVPEQMLKRYVEEGGFLVAEACCGDPEFKKSFEELVGRIFPNSTLKKLPPEHAIWQMFPGITPADFPDLMYIDRGCRTVAIFSPKPLAGYWEEARFMPADGRNPKNQGEKAFCLGRNIIAYATGMELPKPKLSHKTLVKAADTGVARSKFKPVQLRYTTEEPPPASDALRNLMAFLGQNAKLDVTLTSEILQPGDDKLLMFKFMYLHGRKEIKFDETAMDNIKSNLQTGGLLLADAACADFKQWKAFDKSFREAMAKMFPDQKLVEISPKGSDGKDDPLFRIAKESGINLLSVKCRRENAEGTGPEKELRNYPVLLEGIKIDGRWVVIYSKYDIGCAIEGHKSADCLGHDQQSALSIASAVVLYSLKR